MSSAKSYYNELSDKTGKCSLCSKIIKTSGNTSNLLSHLKNRHQAAYTKCVSKSSSKEDADSIQPTISKSFMNAENCKDKTKQVTESLIYMICKDNLPVRCVDKEGLSNFLKTCVPKYELPSRTKVTSLIEEKYTLCADQMKRIFKEIENFSLTCDGVTLTNSTRAFLTVTVHFLKDQILQSICLQAVRMNEPHTGEYICTLLQNTCKEFGIEEFKLETLTTDNAKNMKAASNLLLGVGHHVPCFAHTINLVVDNTVKDIKCFLTVLDKVKRIVTYFKHSPAAMDVLRKLQSDEGVPEGCIRTLTQNIDTRWNSCLDMLISFIDLENTVAIALINRSKSTKILPEMLSTSELDICRDFCELLKPFKEATERVSGESYVTVSLVVPMISMSLAKIRKTIVQSADGMFMKDVLMQKADDYLTGLSKNKILIKASLLDPRIKKMYIPPTMVLEYSKNILEEMQLNSEGKRRSSNLQPPEELHIAQVDRQESFFEAHNRSIQQTQSSDSPYKKEFHLYISLPNSNWEAEPIQYWTSQQQTMPHLAKLALRYLIIPGSSVSSERMASAIKCVVCDSRSRMTDRHVTQRVFLKSLAKQYWK